MLINISDVVTPKIWEHPYILKIFEFLKDYLDDEYNFIIARTNNNYEIKKFEECIIENKKNILILLSDEAGITPPFLDRLHFVFRTYNRLPLYDNKKIFPIPCGYSFGHKDSFYKEIKKKPLIDREYDIFYSAQSSGNRMSCVNNLNKIKKDFKSIVNITNGFAQGYKLEEYYSLMKNSKIAIVPNGVVIPESFRYFEAFESNCIVITTYPKNNIEYNHWYYKDSPAIFISNWNELNKKMVDDLLITEKLKMYDIENRKYFDNNISPYGVSRYMLEIIKNNI